MGEVTLEIYNKYSHIDILINNAGISANKKLEDTPTKEFNDIMNLNVNAMYNMIKSVVPYMKKNNSGVILNTSSMVSIYGQPSGVGYPTSKFAVNGMTKSLARELGQYNIRVNAVAPGGFMVNEVLREKNKIDMPILSDDQKAEIQERILEVHAKKIKVADDVTEIIDQGDITIKRNN